MEAKKNPLSMQIDPALFEAATEDEKRQADVMSESTTFFKDGMRKLMKNPLAVGSIIVLVLIIITITLAPLVVPYSYSEIIKVNGRRDRSNKNLAAFEYSEMEQKTSLRSSTRKWNRITWRKAERYSRISWERIPWDVTTLSVWSTARGSP